MFKNEEGFSLLELVVAVGVAGIIAAVALPTFAGIQDKATTTSATYAASASAAEALANSTIGTTSGSSSYTGGSSSSSTTTSSPYTLNVAFDKFGGSMTQWYAYNNGYGSLYVHINSASVSADLLNAIQNNLITSVVIDGVTTTISGFGTPNASAYGGTDINFNVSSSGSTIPAYSNGDVSVVTFNL